MPTRQRRTHTEDWQQIQQYCLWPEQRFYEQFRPIVLFGDLPAERAGETGAQERTLRRHADRFDREGMRSVFRPTQQQRQDQHRSLPSPMRQCIVDLRVDSPPLSLREIAQICYVCFGRRPSHHTIRCVLADGPRPSRHTRRFPHYAEIADPFERRKAVITLHAEGWTPTSIAAYFAMARSTVYDV